MRKRTALKLLRQDKARPYGRDRAVGSRKGRRGRRAILRACPALKDRSNLTLQHRLQLLARDMRRLFGAMDSLADSFVRLSEQTVKVEWLRFGDMTPEQALERYPIEYEIDVKPQGEDT